MASFVETHQERQDNELQVLQAIFGSDLEDLRKPGPWNSWVPLELCLTLIPQQGNSGLQENHSKIDLHVKCSAQYPDVPPEIFLKNSRGLSNDLVTVLKTELDALSKRHVGEVMIYELTQHVQTFLHQHNCKSEYKSFWDEMYGRQEKKKQQILQDLQKREDQERQQMNHEIQRRKEMLRTEPKMKKVQRSTSESEVSLINPAVERARSYSRKRCQSTSESSEGSQCDHRGTKLLHFSNKGEREIYRGRCLGHSDRGNIFFAGLDMTTGDVVAITEWQFKIKMHSSPREHHVKVNSEAYELSHCMKFIANMEQELNFLTKLRHRNLVNYLNIKYIQENDCISVYLLQEFITGISVASIFIKENCIVEYDMLRKVAEEVLNALDFLHKNNVLHRDVRPSCVFIDKFGVVKLTDYSLDRRLHEFAMRTQAQNKNYTKKSDIFKFGILILSLFRGTPIDENEHPKIPFKLPSEIRDFLARCLEPDERNRWTTTQLLKHTFIRARMERISPARLLDGNASDDNDSSNDLNDKKIEKEEDDDSYDLQAFIPVVHSVGGQSRIQSEFEILKWLGRGAFGDVFKVKNRLDGGCYALKRIRLNPSNKQLNRKITREVKLLSRLNHENVVRYYNSWIESAIVDRSHTSPETADEVDVPSRKKVTNDDLNRFSDDLENLRINNVVAWSVSCTSKNKKPTSPLESSEEESSDDEDDDDDDDDDDVDWSVFKHVVQNEETSSDGIEFEHDSACPTPESQTSTAPTSPIPAITKNQLNVTPKRNNIDKRELQFMYIQMEFCEKSTLRTAIDKGLNKDVDRVWRLFREIAEGLSHIHQQGMIHRDLKPVNIFLDSNDHVKIGDFGLATSNILPRINPDTSSKLGQGGSYGIDTTNSGTNADGSLTGKVGTALYVAPELNSKGSKAIYNQKVDIYSLGIILFEMAYAPLPTAMERVKILGNIRSKEIIFPVDFSENQYARYVTVIRWLLNHDAKNRPTVQELLQSSHIPPPQIEESEFQDLLRRTLANTQSKAYKYLIASCFKQDITPAEDITYDLNNPNKNSVDRPSDKHYSLIEFAKETVVKIFKLHGGQCLTTPLLLPKSKYYEGIESCVKLMTHSGSIVSIPHDLRVPFARYVARNSIRLLKRYSIERVYRERKVFGFQPRELYECAFDIVTPTPGNLTSDAEVLSVVYELIQQFPAFKGKNVVIRLNHTALIRATLLFGGIEQEKHNDIYSILSDARDGKLSKFQVQTHLISLCLTDQAMLRVVELMDSDIPLRQLAEKTNKLLRRKGEVGQLAKKALHELDTIVKNVQALGVTCDIYITPGMVYNVHQYSGMICQFVCELKKKRRKGPVMEVLAAGGRYDEMLNSFRSILGRTGMVPKDIRQSGVGISISLDKLVQALQEEQPLNNEIDNSNNLDVLVCSIGSKPMIIEQCKILRELWASGIRCSLIDSNSLDDIEEQSRELNVTHNIILKESEKGTVLIRSWERDRFQEGKIAISDTVDHMRRILKTWNDSSATESSLLNSLQRSESRTSSFSGGGDLQSSQVNILPNTSVRFITVGDKIAANTRRRFENQILSQINNKPQRLSARCRVDILAINLDMNVVRTMASYIELDETDSTNFNTTVSTIIDKHPRHKRYVIEICDHIHKLQQDKSTNRVIILYSLVDSSYKILL